MKRAVIVDFGMGNLHSVLRAIRRLGGDPSISSQPREVTRADMLVIPGVGHFGRAMDNLASRDLIGPLNAAVLERRVPVLGICLGMQMFRHAARKATSQVSAGLMLASSASGSMARCASRCLTWDGTMSHRRSRVRS